MKHICKGRWPQEQIWEMMTGRQLNLKSLDNSASSLSLQLSVTFQWLKKPWLISQKPSLIRYWYKFFQSKNILWKAEGRRQVEAILLFWQQLADLWMDCSPKELSGFQGFHKLLTAAESRHNWRQHPMIPVIPDFLNVSHSFSWPSLSQPFQIVLQASVS